MNEIVLSIVIITHNQPNEFKRCIDSILTQDLPFKYEIIVSDDSSTDDTWQVVQAYAERYPGVIKITRCNSDVCHPSITAQRSGWNRANGYNHASGKYIVHIDGDDYLLPGGSVYRKQVEMLDSHPDCYLCMANIIRLHEGQSLEKGEAWFKDGTLKNGMIIEGENFITRNMFILNHAIMQRRNPDANPALLYGKRYDDSVITYHHLQYGAIVCVDSCDYVYVLHENSVAYAMEKTSDVDVLWCLGLYIPALIPRWRDVYLSADLTKIKRVVSMARKGYRLQENNRKSLEGLGFYIYDAFNRDLHLSDKIRLFCAEFCLKCFNRLKLKGRLVSKAIYLLVCK